MATDIFTTAIGALIGGVVAYYIANIQENTKLKREAYFELLTYLGKGTYFTKDGLGIEESDDFKEGVDKIEIATWRVKIFGCGRVKKILSRTFKEENHMIKNNNKTTIHNVDQIFQNNLKYRSIKSKMDWDKSKKYFEILKDRNEYDRFYNEVNSAVIEDLHKPWWQFWGRRGYGADQIDTNKSKS